jgi:hypothetical protein
MTAESDKKLCFNRALFNRPDFDVERFIHVFVLFLFPFSRIPQNAPEFS